jgi:hypothetical protein
MMQIFSHGHIFKVVAIFYSDAKLYVRFGHLHCGCPYKLKGIMYIIFGCDFSYKMDPSFSDQ